MKITLAQYDPDWPKMFEQERNQLLEELNAPATVIEHIGSTSVPGLVSKPIIDIMIGLKDFSIANSLVAKIINMDYDYFPQYEEEMPYRRFFKKVVSDTTTHHIHMVETHSEFWQRRLLFRNYLRQNPNTADDYASLKKELAAKDWNHTNDFADAKTEFIRKIEEQAKQL